MQTNKTFLLMLVLLVAAVVICLALWLAAAIGSIDFTTGCLYRYNYNPDGTMASTDGVVNTVIVKANGNYTAVDSGANPNSLTLSQDPNAYGKWVNSNFLVKGGQRIKIEIRGDVSLCRSYLPVTNVQSLSATNSAGRPVPIPRVEESSEPLSLLFDARTDEWRNLLQLFQNDKFVVSLSRDRRNSTGMTTFNNALTNTVNSVDCTDGRRTYSPICGRYSMWSGSYTQTCNFNSSCNCHNINVFGTAPEPYRSDGYFTSPWRSNISSYFINFGLNCGDPNQSLTARSTSYQNGRFFWLSADNAAGLLYRYDTNLTPTSIKNRGTNFAQTSVISNTGIYPNDNQYRVVLNVTNTLSGTRYLQFRYIDSDGGFADNTGGYVINVKHTKCRRSRGIGASDVFASRGFVDYVLMPVGSDPNTASGFTTATLTPNSNGDTEITIPASVTSGTVWLRVKNNTADYIDSVGQYDVKFIGQVPKGTFFFDVLNPLFERLKSTISGASQTIFKNMTCYQGIGATEGKCTNFFNYVRAALILYIITYAALFLLGSVKITQQDIVIRVIKVGLIAGLLNDRTYDFFNLYVFGLATSFSDEIIANMSGYTLFTSSTSITNPFMFLDEVLTKIFLSKTFGAQMMALLSMGLNGVLYFIIVFVALILVIIAALRGIAVYIMAYVAVAVLIGIAPLFLTFILFKTTFHLFANWLKYLIRYMLEPLVMLAGLIILMQLFTIYLDYVISYSVCWKCALAMKIPFPNIAGLSPAFLNVPLFCINWFAPWGNDGNTGQMGINMQHVVAMVILAFCMKNYIDFSSSLVSRITGAYGPSATGMANSMTGAVSEKIMESAGLSKEHRAMIKQQLESKVKDAMSGKRGDGNKEDKLSKIGDRFDAVKNDVTNALGEVNSSGNSSSSSSNSASSVVSGIKGASDVISSSNSSGDASIKPSWSKPSADTASKAPSDEVKDNAATSASGGWKSAVVSSAIRATGIKIGNRRSVVDESPKDEAKKDGSSGEEGK